VGTSRKHYIQQVSGTSAFLKAAERLLYAHGCRGALGFSALSGGSNNKVYKVSAGGKTFLLKHYFRHRADIRNRLDTEFAFCSFAHAHAPRGVPLPLARDNRARIALYEYAEGTKVRTGAVTPALVRQALEFYRGLNEFRRDKAAERLPGASEACFSIDEHLRLVSARVRRLASLKDRSPAGRKAAAFTKKELAPLWASVSREILAAAAERGLDSGKELAPEERRISPSDFGFHNAILQPGGRLKFIDFEYAGWDDPAKTVSDFFCQPAIPVSMKHYPWFLKTVLRRMKNAKKHALRIPVLLPAYRVKWCCIMLNCFLPAGAKRRSFACGPEKLAAQKELQLEKAVKALSVVEAGLRNGNLFPR